MVWGYSLRLALLGILLNLISIAFILQNEWGSFLAILGIFTSLFSLFKSDMNNNIRLFLFGVNLILFSIAIILEAGMGVEFAFMGLIVSLFSLRKTKNVKLKEAKVD